MQHQPSNPTVSYKLLLIVLCAFLLSPALSANNLQVKNLELVDSQRIAATISWQHAWNLAGEQPPYNHDAVWLFLKYRKSEENNWQHARISQQSAGHAITEGPADKVRLAGVADEMGLWIKRQQRGAGPVPEMRIRIQLAEALPEGRYQFRSYGIEMVYVPTDSFYLGDQASNNTLQDGGTGRPFLIDKSGTITAGNGEGELSTAGELPPGGDIPAAYPKGYEGFYAMKYEISQVQYVGFLNTLTRSQQASRVAADPAAERGTLAFPNSRGNRNGIVIHRSASDEKPATFACDANPESLAGANDDGQDRACNFLTWADVAAYLDWAGLAPMTETAFEKLCRGPAEPVAKEFAWGTDAVTDANQVVKDGTPRETVDETLTPNSGLASHGYQGPKGPLRTGFAGADTSTRRSIGAGYYGALELSGNLWELVVTLSSKGLGFEGAAGDGTLTAKGAADEPNWPANNGEGAGFRGGGWNSGILPDFRDLAVSDRFYGYDNPTDRRGTVGGRGVRYSR
jgi:hypothetical protein